MIAKLNFMINSVYIYIIYIYNVYIYAYIYVGGGLTTNRKQMMIMAGGSIMGKIGNHTGYHPNTPPQKKKRRLGYAFQ